MHVFTKIKYRMAVLDNLLAKHVWLGKYLMLKGKLSFLQILVHGEQNEMARLKAALIREYEDNDEVHIEVHNPRNTEAVTLNFRGEKLAKV